MRFPRKIKFRKAVVTIYGRTPGNPTYRISGYVAGKRRIIHHQTYSEALEAAEALSREIAAGSQVLALSPGQASDARAALERLEAHFRQTGNAVPLHTAVAEWISAASKLGKRPLCEAVDTFLSTSAGLKSITVKDAVEEFLASRAHKVTAAVGKRSQLSPGYAYNVAMWLREFAETFNTHQLTDLTAKLLAAYMAAHSKVTPRTRNARRQSVKMFLRWALRNNYLSQNSRLLEADALATELEEGGTIEFYKPAELAAILQAAHDQADCRHLLPVLAINARAGVRLAECVRLEWSDVFAVAGHVTVDKSKSKTRARRLVPICASLALWLEPFRASAGPLWSFGLEKFHDNFNALLAGLKIAPKDSQGVVIGLHYRKREDGSWRYHPTGTPTFPLVVGDLASTQTVWAFESQWGALTALDLAGYHSAPEGLPGVTVIATRGAENGKRLAGLVPPGATLILFPQEDPPKPGRLETPAQKWAREAAGASGCQTVLVVPSPSGFKDLNDALRAGLTPEGFRASVSAATPYEAPASPTPDLHATPPRRVSKPPVVLPESEFEDEAGSAELPLDALPPVIASMVSAVSRCERVPSALPALVALGVTSAAVGAGLPRGALRHRSTFPPARRRDSRERRSRHRVVCRGPARNPQQGSTPGSFQG